MSLINDRYSIRLFSEKEVRNEQIEKILEAAMTAPSSKNKKPWEFLILNNKSIIENLSHKHKSWSVLKNANKVIIVCGNLNSDYREFHTIMACSAATQNILLKSVELGLGSVWLGCFPDEERINILKLEFNIPDNIIPISVVAIGYAKEERMKKRKLDNTKVHHNSWENINNEDNRVI